MKKLLFQILGVLGLTIGLFLILGLLVLRSFERADHFGFFSPELGGHGIGTMFSPAILIGFPLAFGAIFLWLGFRKPSGQDS